jgi:hypothetical protein
MISDRFPQESTGNSQEFIGKKFRPEYCFHFRCFPAGYGDFSAPFLQDPAGYGDQNLRPGLVKLIFIHSMMQNIIQEKQTVTGIVIQTTTHKIFYFRFSIVMAMPVVPDVVEDVEMNDSIFSTAIIKSNYLGPCLALLLRFKYYGQDSCVLHTLRVLD